MSDETSDRLTEDQPLQLIADLIGCSVEDFSTPRGSLGDLGELLRAWHAIEAEADRGKVLELARQLTFAVRSSE